MGAIALSLVSLIVSGAEPTRTPEPKSVDSAVTSAIAATAAKTALDGPELTDLPSWSEAVRAVLLTAIPDKYEDLSYWGKTNEIFDGFQIKQRGFNIRAIERKKRVNNGAWHRYKIELIDPARHLNLTINPIRPIGANQVQFNINLISKLRCRADFEHWILGVKGFNVTVVSEADVRSASPVASWRCGPSSIVRAFFPIWYLNLA